jgi:hypothetical protein
VNEARGAAACDCRVDAAHGRIPGNPGSGYTGSDY